MTRKKGRRVRRLCTFLVSLVDPRQLGTVPIHSTLHNLSPAIYKTKTTTTINLGPWCLLFASLLYHLILNERYGYVPFTVCWRYTE